MASFSLGNTKVNPSGNPLLRIQSNTVSDQGQEGTCYAHTVARIFSRLIKVKFADLFKNVRPEECNKYYSKEDCEDNIFRCFEKEPKCSTNVDGDGMPTENISALLYAYLYKEVRNRYGCRGAQLTDSLQLLIDLFKNQTRILRKNIVSTLLLNGDDTYNIDSSPKREYLYKLIDRLLNIIMVIKQRVANDEIILRRSLPICTTRICPLPLTDYYPEVFNAMNITGYYAGLALYGVTNSRGVPSLAHAVTISGFGGDARSPQLIIKNSWGAIRDWSNVIKDNKVTLFDLPDQVRLLITYVYFKSDQTRIHSAKDAEEAERVRQFNLSKEKDKKDMKKADKDGKKADEDGKKADEDRKKAAEDAEHDDRIRRVKDEIKADRESLQLLIDRANALIARIPELVMQLNRGTNAEKLTAVQSLPKRISPPLRNKYIKTLSESGGVEALINLANNGEPTAKERAKDVLFSMVDSSRIIGIDADYNEIQKHIFTEFNRIDKGIILYIVNRLIVLLGHYDKGDSAVEDLYTIKRLGFAEEILGRADGPDKIEKLKIVSTENETLRHTADWILPQIQDRDVAKNVDLLRNLAESSDRYVKAATFGLLGDFAKTPANIDPIADLMEILVGGLQCKELIYGSCQDGTIIARTRENAARALWNVVSIGNNADDDDEHRPAYVIGRMFQSRAIDELVIALDTGGPKLNEYILGALAAITTSKIASNVILRIKKAIAKIFEKTGPNKNIEIQLNAIKAIHGLVKHEEYRFAIAAAVGDFDVLNKLAASSNEEIKQIATETLVLLEPYNTLERLKTQASTMADYLFIETFEYDIPKAHEIMYNILSEKPNLIINEGTMRYIVNKVNTARVKAPAMKVLVDKMRSDDLAIELLSKGVSAAMLITLAHNCALWSPRDPNSNRVLVPAVTALSKMRPYGRGAHPIFIEENDIIRFIELVMTEPFINAKGDSIDIRPMAIAALKHFLVEEDYRDQYRPNANKFIEFITTATKKLVNILASGEITDAKRLMAVDTLYNMVGPKTTTGDNPYNIIIPLAIANTENCIRTLIRLLASVNEEVKLSAVRLLWRLALANYIALADAGALANYKAFADAWELPKYKAFADTETIRALTDALRAGQHNFKSFAAGVLGIITDTDDNIRKLVNDAGAIPLLIAIASSNDQTGNDYNKYANGALRSLAENVDFATAILNAGYTITFNGGGKTRKHQTHNQNKTNKKNKPNKTNKKTLPSKTRASRKNRNGGRR